MRWFSVIIGIGLATAPALRGAGDKGVEFFERRIRPVLARHCYECHSDRAKDVKGGLRLDSPRGWQMGGSSGRVIRPGEPDQSLLIQAVRHDDSGLRMPPPKHAQKLPDEAIRDLVQWVRMGAPGPLQRPLAAGTRRDASRSDPSQHWSFQPPEKPDPPSPENGSWARTEVDRFILANLEEQGLQPNSPADSRTLIRRLSFDLVGLPPLPGEIDGFVEAAARDRETAVRELVDRLLDSPRFGERWARHWLDVARFAESSGHERNFTYPHAWRYRDYVIAAFNSDKPYDEFLREQVAGDLLPFESRSEEVEQNVATGFLALGPKNHLSKGDKYRLDLADDRIDTLSKAVLGLTIACARCHDHKYDPIPTADYYALAGIFTSTASLHGTVKGKGAGSNNIPADLFVVRGDHEKREAERNALAKRRAQLNENLKNVRKQLGDIPRDDPTPEQTRKISHFRKQKDELSEELKRLPEEPEVEVDYAMAARDAEKPADEPIRIKGVEREEGEVVPRGFPDVLTHGDAPQIDPDSSGRRALAKWLTRPENPLTARVIVNRVWQHLFGGGLVASVDNFGILGEEPSHPELLDYLAVRFMEEGWSIKDLIRLLTTSRVYQLSSAHDAASHAKDPDAIWLWRMRPRRMEVEPLRDAILAVSGQLDLKPPAEGSVVARMGDGCLQRQVKTDPLRENYPWRSIYLPVVRFYAPDMFEAFDGAPATLSLGERPVTNVPGQALFLLNNDFIVEQSRHAARRLLEEDHTHAEARIRVLFERALGRPPGPGEARDAAGFVNRFPGDDPAAVWAALCQALFTTAEFRIVY